MASRYQSRLPQESVLVEVTDTETDEELVAAIDASLERLKTAFKFQLMISGRTMNKILTTPELESKCRNLFLMAESVILYRSSPAQKSEMVKYVRANAKYERTLAIGDGANDVPMIISAHVGVGILSKEGNQAS